MLAKEIQSHQTTAQATQTFKNELEAYAAEATRGELPLVIICR